MRKLLIVLLFIGVCTPFAYGEQTTYKRPPQEIEDLVLTVPTPSPVFNSDCSAVLLMYGNSTIPIEEVPLNGLFIAGVHINPNKYCRMREKGYHTLSFKRVPNGEEMKIGGLPEGGTVLHAVWYPTDDKVLIFHSESEGVYLYSASMEDAKAVRVSDRRINTTARKFVAWVNDTDFITACVVEGVDAPARGVPTGPVVQESLGKKIRKQTIQGLLRDDYDVQCLKHYFNSQLIRISPSGEQTIGEPALYRTISISPNREYLIVYRVIESYSHSDVFMKLKSKTTIEDLEGNVVKSLKQRGNLAWRPDKPATLTWTVSAKKDNPDYKTSLYEQAAPFTEKRNLVIRTKRPFERIYWGNDELALLVEKEKDTITISSFKPGDSEVNTFITYHSKTLYQNPGQPIMVTNEYGRKVLWTNDKSNEVIFNCKGYTHEGLMPELALYKLDKEKRKVIWKCKAPYYEEVIAVKDATNRIFVTSRESFEEPKNFYLCDFKKKSREAITDFAEPYPALKGVTRKFITYTREDGLTLKSLVWLPANYNAKRDGKLPILLWAYPRSYTSAEAASYPRFSQYTHANLPNAGSSMLFWLTQGYCVMENMDMPLIPTDGNKKVNETFVKQITMNAEAAIKALEKAGWGDANRVAVGGHSYGAFMTANLLTHTKLFKAGIARSGAYNRSLTPYGFQDETRNYWGANKIYTSMSPFNYANKLNGAILLVHANRDENNGTHTIQSERYFQALRGQKKFVRYVELPLDGHRYLIRENVLHTLYEVNLWLDKYVKNCADTTPESDKKKDED